MDRNARYILKSYDKSFQNDKQTQVNSYLTREYETKTPPSSSDEDGEGLVVGMLEGVLEWQSLP